jgi:RloB-like protein
MASNREADGSLEFLRRRAGPEPSPGRPGLGDSFLVVTEGEVSEKGYFKNLRTLLQIEPVRMEVRHPDCTDPLGLVRAAREMFDVEADGNKRSLIAKSHRDPEFFDHVWVVFDTDSKRSPNLHEALEMAADEGIRVGLSTPSVELWFVLHLRDRPGALLDARDAVKLLSETWGYNWDKNRKTFERLWESLVPGIPNAVRRGRQVRDYHQGAGSPFPANPSTDLDVLVSDLNTSVKPHHRLF